VLYLIPVGTGHIATVTEWRPARYRCPSCRYCADVNLLAVGRGTTVSPLGIGEGANRELAAEMARRDLKEDEHRTLDLVPCPACGRRRCGSFAYTAASLGRAAGIGAPLLLLTGLATQSWLVGAILCMGGTVASALISSRNRMRAAEQRVSFLPGAVEFDVPQVVGFACAVCQKKIGLERDGEVCVCHAVMHKRCATTHACAERAEAPRL
jgi:hypothetical protein